MSGHHTPVATNIRSRYNFFPNVRPLGGALNLRLPCISSSHLSFRLVLAKSLKGGNFLSGKYFTQDDYHNLSD
jgi:hypothetical protein